MIDQFNQLVTWLRSPQFVWGVCWLGLAVITVTLLVMMRTRWGQSKPLRKCVFLSLLAHLLMAIYSTTVHIVADTITQGEQEPPAIHVSVIDPGDIETEQQADDAPSADDEPLEPWEVFPSSVEPDVPPDDAPHVAASDAQQSDRATNEALPEIPGDRPISNVPDPESPLPEPPQLTVDEPLGASRADERPPSEPPQHLETPTAERADAKEPSLAVPSPPVPQPEPADAKLVPQDPKGAERVPLVVLEQPVPVPRLSESSASSAPEPSSSSALDATTRPPVPATDAVSDEQPPRPTARKLASIPRRPSTDAGTSTTPPTQPSPGESQDSNHASPLGESGSATSNGDPSAAGGQSSSASTSSKDGAGSPDGVPSLFRHRVAPNRGETGAQYGATAQTEGAVEAALAWLAASQSSNGRWDADRFGAGHETYAAGRDRRGAGADADTGVTGLALLAFLGAGYTHENGTHAQTVRRGLEFLIRTQRADGSLGGDAAVYAHMYCHGMAAIALGEALGLTGDVWLQQPVRRAMSYTLAAQHPSTGGWRYRPGDLGDTSQLGWQLMALKSAEIAGMELPARSTDGMVRYLKSVASGTHGGLASYRPKELPSPTMTAEALVCRQFLGVSRQNPSGIEAGDYLLDRLPRREATDLYYWYYGTLGMFQLQGDYWTRWNAAMQNALLSTQRTDGVLAGSWDADAVWGGYGGRVYATAMAALCLEVYYRFLPLYSEQASRGGRTR